MTATESEDKNAAWFCLHSQPRHEHIAAAHLRKMEGVQVFLPRIRFKRATRQKPVWVTEALFPGYLFARFSGQVSRRQVQHAPGVRGIVHFGNYFPVIGDGIIEELKRTLGTSELHTISGFFSPGDPVQIAEGTLRGLRAVVTRVMPGRERVAVLMELLGQQTTVELTVSSIIKEGPERAAIFQGRGEADGTG